MFIEDFAKIDTYALSTEGLCGWFRGLLPSCSALQAASSDPAMSTSFKNVLLDDGDDTVETVLQLFIVMLFDELANCLWPINSCVFAGKDILDGLVHCLFL